MTVPSKNFTAPTDGQIDADSPLDTTLLTQIRDALVHLEEWLGKNYTAAVDHDHDNTNSKTVAGLRWGDGKGTCFLGIVNMPQNATRYFVNLGGTITATEAEAKYVAPGHLTIKDLYVKASAAPPAGQTFTVTLRKNGVDTAVTAQITSAGVLAYDTVNSVSFGPNDEIAWKCVASATTGSTIDLVISFRHLRYGTTYGWGLFPFNMLTDATFVQDLNGVNATPITTTSVGVMPVTGEVWVTDYSAKYSTAPASAVETFFLDNTLVPTDGLVPTGAHYIYFRHAAEATAPRVYGSYSLGVRDVVDQGNKTLLCFGSRSHAQNTTLYMPGVAETGTATETEVQVPVTAGTLKNLTLASKSAGVAGQTWTATIRKNGVDTALVVVLDGVTEINANTTDTVTVAAGDLISVKLVSSATTGTRQMSASFEHV